jgi:hypothetical protein
MLKSMKDMHFTDSLCKSSMKCIDTDKKHALRRNKISFHRYVIGLKNWSEISSPLR